MRTAPTVIQAGAGFCMNTTKIGHQAEATAVAYLEDRDFEVIDRNWRSRYCEIDIIACRREAIYFIEVKYRITNDYGRGLDFISPPKLKQMAFADQIWIHNHSWPGDYRLAAIEVSGKQFKVTGFLPDL